MQSRGPYASHNGPIFSPLFCYWQAAQCDYKAADKFTREERRASRTATNRHKIMVAKVHRYGLVGKFGNIDREIPDVEFFKVMGTIHRAYIAYRLDADTIPRYLHFLKFCTSWRPRHNRPMKITWETWRYMRDAAKYVKEQDATI